MDIEVTGGMKRLGKFRTIVISAALCFAFSLPVCGFAALAVQQTEKLVPAITTEAKIVATDSDDEWYEQGLWPLAGAVLAIIVSNSVSIFIIYLQSKKSFDAILKQRRIEFLSSSLKEFYDPLLAIVGVNKQIISKTGPPSFPEGQIERDAAASVWSETRKKIIENNFVIEGIITKNCHLIHENDSIENYNSLLLHVVMYDVFQKVKTDIYSRFLFPKDVEGHIRRNRDLVVSEYRDLVGRGK